MSKLAKALTAAAGNAGEDNLYVEDVFSTYVRTGTGDSPTITNDIDLAGEGGLVWVKSRSQAYDHNLFDTERGTSKKLVTNSTDAEGTISGVTAFNSDGFTLGDSPNVDWPAFTYAYWTFRKAENFFDIVTYTGDGTTGRDIAHNLGSRPGFVMIKRTDTSSNWAVWAKIDNTRAITALNLNTTAASGVVVHTYWMDGMTSSVISLAKVADNGSGNTHNVNGGTYVAYLFASDAGGFGDDGSENIIKCGSYVGTSDTAPYKVSVDVGFEPQWLLVKNVTTGGAGKNWLLVDTMRGFFTDTADLELRPNTSDLENSSSAFNVTSTGFSSASGGEPNIQGNTYIYIAIRRPMKTPESGTEVFAPVGATSTAPLWKSSFPVDAGLYRYIIGTSAGTYFGSRLTGTGRLESSSTAAEVADSSFKWDYMNGWFNNSFNDTNYVGYNFKRATGFFDVVAYTGDGVAGRTVEHNLTVAPEMILSFRRNSGTNRRVYAAPLGATKYLTLDAASDGKTLTSMWNDTEPTSSVFSLGTFGGVNGTGDTFIAYLFATLAGVSKVGSYTGTGSNVDVDCGFSAGARFILIKRTDSTGDWYTYDSFRGIVAGNDPYILMNTTAAEVTSTDYIDPLASGFTVTSSAPAALNASGGTYIYLSIA